MAIEIVDFTIKNGGSFHRFLYVYQRVQYLRKFSGVNFMDISYTLMDHMETGVYFMDNGDLSDKNILESSNIMFTFGLIS